MRYIIQYRTSKRRSWQDDVLFKKPKYYTNINEVIAEKERRQREEPQLEFRFVTRDEGNRVLYPET